MVLGVSAAPLDSSVNIAFPDITASFGLPVESIQWVIIGYVLTYASLVLGAGRLGDVIGHRRVFLTGILVTLVALLACAAAPAFGWLIAARIAQGVGSALLLGAGPALITLAYPESQRLRTIGIYTLCFGLSGAVGPALGGLLVTHFGWPGVFWFRTPVLLVALAVLAVTPVPRPPAGTVPARFNALGGGSLVAALVCLLLALGQGQRLGWTSVWTVLLLVLGTASAVLFVRTQRADPDGALFDLGVLRSARFSATSAVHILVSLAHFAVLLLVPYFLVRRLDGDVTLAGLLLAADPVGVMIASAIIGRWQRGGVGDGFALLAVALVALGLGSVSLWSAQVALPLMVASLLLCGAGFGFYQVTAMDRVMATLPRDRRGVAGAMNMLTRTIGVVTAASLGTALFTAAGGNNAARFHEAFSTTLASAAVVAVLALALLAVGQWRGAPLPPPDRP